MSTDKRASEAHKSVFRCDFPVCNYVTDKDKSLIIQKVIN